MNTSKYIELAPGLTICRAVTGLWQIADLERDGTKVEAEKAAAAMDAYAKAGFTTFDMADHYGSAEEIAGVFQTKYAKGKAQLLTKWVPTPGTIKRQQVRDAVERALERMQSAQIDLMQFHAWSYAHPSWVDALLWLQELKNEGLIRYIGLTNFDSAHLSIVINSGIEVVSNQVCYSLLDQRAAGRMAEICKKYSVKLLAFGTVAGGFLSEKWLNKPEPVLNDSLTWSQMKYKRFIDTAGGWDVFQTLLSTLDQVAKKYNVGIANIASKYMLEQPAVGGVIIGARLGQSEHITENEKLFSFELDSESKRKIALALSMLKPIPGDCGDEYRKPPFLTASGDLSHHVESFPAPYPAVQGSDRRSKALSGTVWEDLAGFSRAVRKGNRILVSGTTATHGSKAMCGNDPAAQTHFIIDKIEGAIQSLGGTLNDVVRTRIFIRNINDWEPIARAHGERFKDIQPANTMVKAELIGDEYLVEMEAEAIVE
ncbi:MAG: aldo/keto reductase [Cyclobacteriaceae bacterium]|nr:aldo/keto reductase [Cyclobacteriaceae bacterium]UYN87675.1 MAG: aldo/keto reductase [Cyclobacteriaceae bacterium]